MPASAPVLSWVWRCGRVLGAALRRPRARAAAGRRRRRRHAPPVPGRRPARDDASPTAAPSPTPTPPPRRRCAPLIAAERPGDAVLGEEGGGEVPESGAALGARPDRRHEELLPRHARLGDADRVDRRRPGRRSASVSAPALGRRWWGAAGQGAWTSDAPGGPPRRIAVSGVGRPRRRLPVHDRPARVRPERRLDRWLALVDAVWETRAFGDFWQHCLVAEGVLDVAVDPVANPWDLAALGPSSPRRAGG